MKVLMVAEKPSIAKQVASLLAGHDAVTRRRGPSKYNLNFCFPITLDGREAPAVMTSVLGHVTTLDFPPEYSKSWNTVPMPALFTAPVIRKPSADMDKVVQNLVQEARGVTDLLIWTDCDQEGEHIGFEIINICLRVAPNARVRRAHFSAVSARDVHRAMATLTEMDRRLSDAVEARAELDLRIGAAFTRLQTLTLEPRFADLHKRIISYGPCQFPTIGFVIDRYMRIQNFVPEPLWKIVVQHKKANVDVAFGWQRVHLFDEAICRALHDRCMRSMPAVVTKVQTRPTTKYRPLPLTTVELQKAASTFLRMSSSAVMKIAEELYNQGFISYPRTETDSFERGFDFRGLVERQTGDRDWGTYARDLLAGGLRMPRNGRHNDHAHPPIHPTKASGDMNQVQRKVFEFVTRRFLACVSDDARGEQKTVEIKIGREVFSASGLVVTQRNFLDVYPYWTWKNHAMAPFVEGETFIPDRCDLERGSTTAPHYLTEAELITLMDNNGIGTDATIHEHIAKVQEREYVYKHNDYFVPSTLGVALVEAYEGMGYELSKPHLRAKMEADMKRICEGTMTREQVVAEAVRLYSAIFDGALGRRTRLIEAVSKYFNVPPSDGPHAADDGGDEPPDEPEGPPPPPPTTFNPLIRARADPTRAAAAAHRPASPQPPQPPQQQPQPQQPPSPPQQQQQLAAPPLQRRYDPPPPQRRAEPPPPQRRAEPPPPQRRVDPQPPPPPEPIYVPDEDDDFDAPFIDGFDAPSMDDFDAPPLDDFDGPPMDDFGVAGGRAQVRLPGLLADGEANILEAGDWSDDVQPYGQPGRPAGRNHGAAARQAQRAPPPPPTQRHQRPRDEASLRDFLPPGVDSFGAEHDGGRFVCHCGTVATQFTVNKAGPNQGRKFFVCAKRQEDPARCTFFMWADDGAQNDEGPARGAAGYAGAGDRSRYGGGGSGNGKWSDAALRTAPPGTGPGQAGNVCYQCNQPGHWASACPQRNGRGGRAPGGGFRRRNDGDEDDDMPRRAPRGGRGRGGARGYGSGAARGRGRR